MRKVLPRATLVVGGHIANTPAIEALIDADHIVKGGRNPLVPVLLGAESECPPSAISEAYSGYGSRVMGHTLHDKPDSRRHRGDRDPIGGMSSGVQFLLDLRPVRRQGQVHQLL